MAWRCRRQIKSRAGNACIMAKAAKIHCLSRKLEKSLKKQAKAKVRKEGKKQAKIILD